MLKRDISTVITSYFWRIHHAPGVEAQKGCQQISTVMSGDSVKQRIGSRAVFSRTSVITVDIY
jgi:hypothetical protein